MRFQMKQRGGFLLLIALTFMFSGCLPKEEVLQEAPVLKIAETSNYKKVEVLRGDIIESVTIDCTYTALETEDLKFPISQVPIGQIYVKEGDRVKKGDVLADLSMEDIEEQLEGFNENLERLNLQLNNQEELKALTITNHNILKKVEGYTKFMENHFAGEIAVYVNEIEKIMRKIYIEEKRFKAAQEELENHRITAGMDGVVSYVATFNKGDISNKESTYITIYGPDKMLFLTEGLNVDKLRSGMKVTVLLSLGEVKAEVLNSEDIGSKEIPNSVYLKELSNNEKLQLNDRGRIILILNQVEDVLYLPTSVVHEENGKSIVYVEDEDGFKSIKEIEAGFSTDRKVEILSGLMEGDSVILQ